MYQLNINADSFICTKFGLWRDFQTKEVLGVFYVVSMALKENGEHVSVKVNVKSNNAEQNIQQLKDSLTKGGIIIPFEVGFRELKVCIYQNFSTKELKFSAKASSVFKIQPYVAAKPLNKEVK